MKFRPSVAPSFTLCVGGWIRLKAASGADWCTLMMLSAVTVLPNMNH